MSKDQKTKTKISLPKSKTRGAITKWLKDHLEYSIEELSILSGISRERIIKWKIMYDVINKKTEKDIIAMWIKYKEYTVSEAMAIFGEQTILDVEKKYGVKIPRYANEVKVPSNLELGRKKIEYPYLGSWIIEDKEILRKFWMKFTAGAIAKMAGVKSGVVKKTLEKYELDKIETYPKPYRPGRSREWLIEHYVEKGMTSTECAELLGVHRKAICKWMRQFGIRPRFGAQRFKPRAMRKYVTTVVGDED